MLKPFSTFYCLSPPSSKVLTKLFYITVLLMFVKPSTETLTASSLPRPLSRGQRAISPTALSPAAISSTEDSNFLRRRPVEYEPFSEEHRLQRHLLRPYDSAVRPLRNSSGVVTVNLTMTLTQISQVDERNQIVTMNVWLAQKWFDEHMTWEPTAFANITSFRIPADKLWLPDIVLYNNADDYNKEPMKINVVVYSNGEIHWIPPMKLRVVCPIDTTYFPFDDQTCKLKLGSWIYDGDQLNIEKGDDKIVLDDYQENGEWNITSISIERRVVKYNCCAETWPSIFFTFNLRRKTIYYSYNVIAPCIMLSALTIALFYLPSQSNEKVTLGLTVLLAYMVFMLMIRDRMPETSDSLPLLGLYIMTDMFLSAFSVALAVGVLSCHYRGTNANRGPRWLRFVAFQILEPLVTCCRTRHSYYKFDALMLSNRRRAAVSAAGGDTVADEHDDNHSVTMTNGVLVHHNVGPPSTSLVSLANIYGNEQLGDENGDGTTTKRRKHFSSCTSDGRNHTSSKVRSNYCNKHADSEYEEQLLRRFASPSTFSLRNKPLPRPNSDDDQLSNNHVGYCAAHHHHQNHSLPHSRGGTPDRRHNATQHQQAVYDEYVLSNVRTIVDKMHLTTHKNIALDEWKQMAEIFDKFFFFIFLFGITAMTVGMLKVWPLFKTNK